MIPMRETQRRKLLQNVRVTSEKKIAILVARLFNQRFKSLKRELRRANLRKRLAKLQGVLLFQKTDPYWMEWIENFNEQLTKSFEEVIAEYSSADNEYWTSHGKEPKIWDTAEVVRAYEKRVGRLIVDISEGTLTQTQSIISSWFNTEKTLPDLIKELEPLYGATRAALIAATEMVNITSEVAREQMEHFGINQWTWDASNDAFTCEICADLHGQHFSVDDLDAYPPAHPNCHCGTLFTGDDGKEIYYKYALGDLEKGGAGFGRYPAGSGGSKTTE